MDKIIIERVKSYKRICNKLQEMGYDISWLMQELERLKCKNVKSFEKGFVDAELLFSISKVIGFDFFADYSEELQSSLEAKKPQKIPNEIDIGELIYKELMKKKAIFIDI